MLDIFFLFRIYKGSQHDTSGGNGNVRRMDGRDDAAEDGAA